MFDAKNPVPGSPEYKATVTLFSLGPGIVISRLCLSMMAFFMVPLMF